MIAIVGLGFLANTHWPDNLASLSTNLSMSAGDVTRIEAIVGSQDNWSLAIIIIMTAIAATILVAQHWFRVKRMLNRGEQFIVKHPFFDIVLVAICTLGVVLTRTY